jgi:riboflavin kinase / FMN adenylyltransferase
MQPSILTLGNFDGVHLGHQALLHAARTLADQTSSQLIALTFDPHPAQLLAPAPGKAPPLITDIATRKALLHAHGADHVHVITPTRQLLLQEPESFIQHLIDSHAMRGIVEGPDFHFGHNRRGDIAMLQTLGLKKSFQTIIVPPVHVELTDHHIAEVRSTLIRWLLSKGRVADAARALARPYALTSTIIQGEQRGRTINVPTANLDLSPFTAQNRILPAEGVYAGTALLPSGQSFPAAISLGKKPSFGSLTLTLEAHLLGFQGDLYNTSLTLQFHRYLRDQMRFPTLDSLKSQLTRDLAQVTTHHQ